MSNAIHGTVNGKEAIVFIDAGAESTLVSSNLVSEGNYTGDSICLEFANATSEYMRLAEVCIHVKDLCVNKIVAVEPEFTNKVLLGLYTSFPV